MVSWKRNVLPIAAAGLWIAFSEFLRNELLFKSKWVDHYLGLGLVFPSGSVNGAVWGIWSFLFAAGLFVLMRRFTLVQSGLVVWLFGFVLMWLVIGNLGVLPFGLLVWAVPLSLVEVFGAAWIIHRLA